MESDTRGNKKIGRNKIVQSCLWHVICHILVGHPPIAGINIQIIVAGIGRDDNTGLDQRKSLSINTGAAVTLDKVGLLAQTRVSVTMQQRARVQMFLQAMLPGPNEFGRWQWRVLLERSRLVWTYPQQAFQTRVVRLIMLCLRIRTQILVQGLQRIQPEQAWWAVF